MVEPEAAVVGIGIGVAGPRAHCVYRGNLLVDFGLACCGQC